MSDKVTKEVDIKVGAPGAEKVPGLFARIGHEIHEMNQQARGGGLHGLETILKGAGVAAALNFAAEKLTEWLKITREYAEGALSIQEAIAKAVETVPVLGTFFNLGREIGALWDEIVHHEENARERLEEGWNEHADKIKKTEEGLAAAFAAKSYGYEKPGGLYGRRQDLLSDLMSAQEKLQRNAGTPYLGDIAQTDYEMGFEKSVKELYRVRDEIARHEGSFMRNIRTGVSQFVDYGWRGVAANARQAIRDGVKAANDRQDEIDLEAWRGAAEAMKSAEESFMSDYELDVKHRKEELMKMASDDRLTPELRQKALAQAGLVGGIIPGGYSPNVQGNLLTGAHAKSGEARAGSEQKIEKNTEKTAKGVDDAAGYLKDIAEAFKQRPGIIMGIGL